MIYCINAQREFVKCLDGLRAESRGDAPDAYVIFRRDGFLLTGQHKARPCIQLIQTIWLGLPFGVASQRLAGGCHRYRVIAITTAEDVCGVKVCSGESAEGTPDRWQW